MFKVATSILLCCFLFVCLAPGGAFAAEKKEKKSKSPEKKTSSTEKKEKEEDPFQWTLSLEVPLYYSSNVFQTPSEPFINPETGNFAEATPSSGWFFEPQLGLELEYRWTDWMIFGFTNKSQWTRHLEGDFLTPADGNESKNSFFYRGESSDQKWELGREAKTSNYNYLHRGTGQTRVSKSKKKDIADRYRYSYSGNYLKYKLKFLSDYKFSLGYDKIKKDYIEIEGYSSLDRDEITEDFSLSKSWGKQLKLKLNHEVVTLNYHTAFAYNSLGKRDGGILQQIEETTDELELDIGPKSLRLSPTLTKVESLDTHQGFWSFSESEAALELQYKLRKRLYLIGSYSSRNRQYLNETNVYGQVRSQTGKIQGLALEYALSKSQDMSFEYQQESQIDDDTYYSFEETEITMTYILEF